MKRIFTLLPAIILVFAFSVKAQINVTVLNKATSYANNLDSLARTGTSALMPAGWHFYQSNGKTTYRANAGDSTGANVYSYGANTGLQSRIRALGSISAKTDSCYFGAEFVNHTGYPLSSITIAYTIQQWHLGATGRQDTTEFDFSTDATTLVKSGKWTHIDNLDMLSPVTSGTLGALNGNQAANQSKVSFTLKGLNIANGEHFWIRWYDHPIKGNNDGMGVQALTITYYSQVAGPTVVKKINLGKFPQTGGIPDTTVYGKFHGVILSPNFLASGSGLQFSIRDTLVATGFQAGIGAITCHSTSDMGGVKVNIGDSVYVTGKIRSNRFLTYMEMDTLQLLKSAAQPNPTVITANTISDNNESNLIKLSNLTLQPTATWDTTGASVLGGFTTTARGALGNVTIFINKNSDIFNKVKPNFPFNLTGIAMQSSTNANNGYFIWPRFLKDIDTLPQPKLALKNIGDINQYRTTGPARFYGQADSANKRYFIKGVVHSPNLYSGGLYFNLIDKTGAITVYNVQPVDAYNPKTGDSVLVRGTVLQQNTVNGGLIVFAPDSIKVLPKGTALTPPIAIKGPITKTSESYLIKLQHVKLVDVTAWDSTLATAKNLNMFEVRVASSTDTFFMEIPKTTDLFRSSPINGLFTVTGVCGENSTNLQLPFNDHYTIIPRGSFDIVQGRIPHYAIGQIKGFNAASGRADSVGVACYIKGVVQSPNISDSGSAAFALADNTGNITALNLSNLAYTATIGDSVQLLGSVGQYAGLTYFAPDSIGVLNTKNAPVSPVIIQTPDETDESGLVTLQGYTMWNPNEWDNLLPANKLGFNVHYVRNADTVIVHISHNITDLYNLPYASKLLGKVDITGIELQRTNLLKNPFSNYYIVPRMISDISENTGIDNASGRAGGIVIYPNPAGNAVTIKSDGSINSITIADISGRQLVYRNENMQNTVIIDLSDLKAGLYLVKISTDKGAAVQKLIRQ